MYARPMPFILNIQIVLFKLMFRKSLLQEDEIQCLRRLTGMRGHTDARVSAK